MPYTADISRKNPTCFLFLVDQSGSMTDPVAGGQGLRKADGVADAINATLQTLIVRATKQPPAPWDYYEIGVIGYGATVGPAFSGSLVNRTLVKISEIYNSPAKIREVSKKVPNGAGGFLVVDTKFPVWFEPVAGNGTPMAQGIVLARATLKDWCENHPSAYPPIVINITDGEAEGDLVAEARQLTDIATNDGNVLFLNCHISSNPAPPIEFPSSDEELPDAFARQLFAMSSVLPEPIRAAARSNEFTVRDGSRGFIFNADLVKFIEFINVGTQPSKDLR